VVEGPREASCTTTSTAAADDDEAALVAAAVMPTMVVSTKLNSGSDIQMRIVVAVKTISCLYDGTKVGNNVDDVDTVVVDVLVATLLLDLLLPREDVELLFDMGIEEESRSCSSSPSTKSWEEEEDILC
jgi:hypothetical protein